METEPFMRAGAVQRGAAWGKSPAMPPSRFQSLSTDRRRRGVSPGIIALIVLVLIAGFLFFMSTLDTEKPTSRMEQDVTDALPKS